MSEVLLAHRAAAARVAYSYAIVAREVAKKLDTLFDVAAHRVSDDGSREDADMARLLKTQATLSRALGMLLPLPTMDETTSDERSASDVPNAARPA